MEYIISESATPEQKVKVGKLLMASESDPLRVRGLENALKAGVIREETALDSEQKSSKGMTENVSKYAKYPAGFLQGAAEVSNPLAIPKGFAWLTGAVLPGVTGEQLSKNIPAPDISTQAASIETLGRKIGGNKEPYLDLYNRILAEKKGYAEGLPEGAKTAGEIAAILPAAYDLGKTGMRVLSKGGSKIPGLVGFLQRSVKEGAIKRGLSDTAAKVLSESADTVKKFKKIGPESTFESGQNIGKAAKSYMTKVSEAYDAEMTPLLKTYGKKPISLREVYTSLRHEMMDRAEIEQGSSFGKFIQRTLQDLNNSGRNMSFSEAQKLKKAITAKYSNSKAPEAVPDLSKRDTRAARDLVRKIRDAIDKTIVDKTGNSLTKPINDAYYEGKKSVEMAGELVGKKDEAGYFKKAEASIRRSVSPSGTRESKIFNRVEESVPGVKLPLKVGQEQATAALLKKSGGPTARLVSGSEGTPRGILSGTLSWLYDLPHEARVWTLGKLLEAGKITAQDAKALGLVNIPRTVGVKDVPRAGFVGTGLSQRIQEK